MSQGSRPLPVHVSNGDEQAFPRYIAVFAKGLPHNQLGEVEPGAYESVLRALQSGKHEDFERISIGSGRRLVSPQAAFSYHLEGEDSHSSNLAPAPAFASAEAAAEMLELYWQALARNVAFEEYPDSPVIRQAAQDLRRLAGFAGPRIGGQVTPSGPRARNSPAYGPGQAVFRGNSPGDLDGPYVSQFLWKPVPYGSGKLDQRYRTPPPGADYVTSYPEWLQIQTGVPPWRESAYDQTPRYIRNGRDLAEYVHYDYLYQAFLHAALILLDSGPETVLNYNSFISERNPYKHSRTQDGFVTFGLAHVTDWLARVTTAGMKACWCQKWLVHRRLRPEEFAGRIHHAKGGTAAYPIHSDLLNSPVLDAVKQHYGTYLLPQAYPEACPLHPAYPSGHATVVGACATVLKAFFDESALIPNCVMASADGLSLMACPELALTVGNELNKLAFNIAMGRNFAGIHYRSDASGGLKLGEEVAISVLQDLVHTITEDFLGFRFTRFDGSEIIIRKE